MKIGFAGAGGVGCYFGGMLSNGGLDISLIVRNSNAEILKKHGLKITENGQDFHVRPRIIDSNNITDLQHLIDLDWLVFTCKSHQTEALANQLVEHIGDNTQIASLQNGIDNTTLLSKIIGRPVVGGLSIRFAAHIKEPGHVNADGEGYCLFGNFPTGCDTAVKKMITNCAQAGVDVRETEDIQRELWRKILINNGVNPMTALLQRDSEFVLNNPMTLLVVKDLMLEAARAAACDGVDLSDADIKELLSIVAGLGPIKSSMQVDLKMGRELELDAICGAVIDRGATIDVPATVTKTLYRLLKSIAVSGRR